MANRTPAADLDIDEALVRELLRDQHPDFADEPLQLADVGWDNTMYRLGGHHAVRLPRRKLAAALAVHEQTWLPVLASRLPVPTPEPVRLGQPGRVYPWTWSIVPWLTGTTADLDCPDNNQAGPLAEFLRALHRCAPHNAPKNDLRGVPLAQRADVVVASLNRLSTATDAVTPRLLDVWRRALCAAESAERVWLHGDLHARNVLVSKGEISGIIDWGDVSAGDAATDVAGVWMLLRDASARAACLRQYGADDALVARAKGWAVLFGTTLLETGLADHPRHAAMGAATLQRLGEDE